MRELDSGEGICYDDEGREVGNSQSERGGARAEGNQG